jgi:hypothetical protein
MVLFLNDKKRHCRVSLQGYQIIVPDGKRGSKARLRWMVRRLMPFSSTGAPLAKKTSTPCP